MTKASELEKLTLIEGTELIPVVAGQTNKLIEVDDLVNRVVGEVPSVDLGGYYTKPEVNALIPAPTDLSSYYTKTEVDALLANSGGGGTDPNPTPVTFPTTVDESISPLTAELISEQEAYPIIIELSNLGQVQSGDRIWQERRALDGSIVERKSYLLSDANWPTGGQTTATIDFDNDLITSGTHRFVYYVQKGTSRSIESNLVIAGPDDIKPVLSVAVTPQQTLAALLFSVNEASTIYYVVDTSLTATAPTGTQIRAGQNSTGAAALEAGSLVAAASGGYEMNADGLTGNSDYTLFAVAVDQANLESDIETAAFTTIAANAPAVFDPDNKSSHATLSNDNQTITCVPSLGEGAPSRLIREVPVGADVYVELTAANYVNSRMFLGICTVDQVSGTGSYFGNAAMGTFWAQGLNTQVYVNGSVQLRNSTLVNGDVLCMRVRRIDADTVMQSFRLNDGAWSPELERTMTSCYVFAACSSTNTGTIDATEPYQFPVPTGSGSHP